MQLTFCGREQDEIDLIADAVVVMCIDIVVIDRDVVVGIAAVGNTAVVDMIHQFVVPKKEIAAAIDIEMIVHCCPTDYSVDNIVGQF